MLLDLLRPAPVASIDEVLSIMTAIDSRLPDSDGVKWFNRLYLQVTRSVRQAVSGPAFRDARFMTELDVVFANQYLAAIAAGEADVSRAPSAWRPLIRARSSGRIARLQFALAGMNAHINRDLPRGSCRFLKRSAAIRRRIRRAGRTSTASTICWSAWKREVRADFSVGAIAVVDDLASRADDVAAMWKVRAARHAAWTNAEVFWTLRRTPHIP